MVEAWPVAAGATRWLYTLLVGLVVVQRLLELRLARRNTAALRARGAVEAGAGHYPVMVALHSTFLASCLVEVWWLGRPLLPPLAALCLALLVAAGALRIWVLRTLGPRWTTRILCLPGEPVVTAGPYRHLRHPNYLAVCVEILALPLLHTAWITALIFTLANAALLRLRIRREEEALRRHSDYDRVFR